MAKNNLRGKDLSKLGYTTPKSKSIALDYCNRIAKHSSKKEKLSLLEDVLFNAEKYKDHDILGKLAAEFIVVNEIAPKHNIDIKRESGDFNVFGREHVTSSTIQQMGTAMRLPIAEKGATPAAKGEFGVIPGSMTANCYIVVGKGSEGSLDSASHGAGRELSRSEARLHVTEDDLKNEVEYAGVSLVGGGVDESPFAYKDIDQVIARQTDLIDVVGTFLPKIVRMSGTKIEE